MAGCRGRFFDNGYGQFVKDGSAMEFIGGFFALRNQ